jgi:hypothetical protein
MEMYTLCYQTHLYYLFLEQKIPIFAHTFYYTEQFHFDIVINTKFLFYGH